MTAGDVMRDGDLVVEILSTTTDDEGRIPVLVTGPDDVKRISSADPGRLAPLTAGHCPTCTCTPK